MDEPYLIVAQSPDPEIWKKSVQFANLLLSIGKTVYWNLEPFTVRCTTAEERFEAGSFIIPLEHRYPEKTDLAGLLDEDVLLRNARVFGVELKRSLQEIPAAVLRLKSTRIALFADGGSPYPFADIFGTLGFSNYPLTCEDIRSGALGDYDLLVIPGGGRRSPLYQANVLGDKGREMIRAFVRKGGGLWGSCAGCINLITVPEAQSKRWEALYPGLPPFRSCCVINCEYWSTGWSGIGLLKVRNVNPNQPIMFGLPDVFEVTYHLGPFLCLVSRPVGEASDPIPLLQLHNVTENYTAAEFMYAQSKQWQPGSMEDTYTLKGIRGATYCVVAGYYGKGKVCAAGCHPEFGLDWLLKDWGQPARMLVNFALWVSSTSPLDRRSTYATCIPKAHDSLGVFHLSPSHALSEIVNKAASIKTKLNKLTSKALQPLPEWLQEERAAASFGLKAEEKWPLLLKEMENLCDTVPVVCEEIRSIIETSRGRLHLRNLLSGYSASKRAVAEEALRMLQTSLEDLLIDIVYVRPKEWNQDYGWNGMIHLMSCCNQRVEAALCNHDESSAVVENGVRYSQLDARRRLAENTPYMNLWGLYLGAIYDLINALIVARNRVNLVRQALHATELLTNRQPPEKERP